MNLKFPIIGIFLGLVCAGVFSVASDHDDGEIDLKGRALNITDVYAFREDAQTGNANDAGNLILVMNTNPRSLPGQQYFFSTTALYQIHLSRVTADNKNKRPTGEEDVVIRMQFGTPNDTGNQNVTVTWINNGAEQRITGTTNNSPIITTTLADSRSGNLNNNTFLAGGETITLFAGLREDPFFFDVIQFFKVRDAAVATGQFIGFQPANKAIDFTKNYNVNSIVLRVPIGALQSPAEEPVFDVWSTIMVPR